MTVPKQQDWVEDWELCQRAGTPPWEVEIGRTHIAIREVVSQRIIVSKPIINREQDIADFRFIARAREGWPAALARVWELEITVRALREQLKQGARIVAALAEQNGGKLKIMKNTLYSLPPRVELMQYEDVSEQAIVYELIRPKNRS